MANISDLGNGLASITFTITQDGMSFTDAIVDTYENLAALTDDQISTLQNMRFENWLITVQATSNQITPEGE